MRFLPAALIAVAILLTPLVYLGGQMALVPPSSSAGGGGGGGGGIDSGARIDIELLREEVEGLRGALAAMEGKLAAIQDQLQGALERLPGAPPPGSGVTRRDDDGPNRIVDAYSQVVLIANRRNVNAGLTVPSRDFLIELLGRPRPDLNDDCQGITNATLEALVYTGRVGPIRVTLLRPAVASLQRVFDRVREVDVDLYDRINTAGGLCVRRIRGTVNTLSSHAFGLAVDLNIDGQLDGFGDGKTQLGLTILADFFKEEGWIWGAGFGREDSMHFEVSQELLERWRAEGVI